MTDDKAALGGVWKEDHRPARNGWTPGDYINKCRNCAERFVGAKRAWLCADCAYAEPEALLPAQRGDNDMTRDDGLRDPRYKGRAALRGEGDDVERVAIALWKNQVIGHDYTWDQQSFGTQTKYRRQARAAIAALPRSTEGWQCVPTDVEASVVAVRAAVVHEICHQQARHHRTTATELCEAVPAGAIARAAIRALTDEAYRARVAPAAGAERSGEDAK